VEEKEDGEIDEESESDAGANFRMSADDFGSRLSAVGLSNGPTTYITEKNPVLIMLLLAVRIKTITIVIRSRKRRKQY
jgi:hypothetical protein